MVSATTQKRSTRLDDAPREVRRAVRSQSMMEMIAGKDVKTIVDIGCGFGQDLYPFLAVEGATLMGTDYIHECCIEAKRLLDIAHPAAPITFMSSSCTNIPLRSGSCDVVVCRAVLPLVDNDKTLAELSRIMSPNGVLFLKVHACSFYLRKIWKFLRAGNVRQTVYATRVLVSGTVFNIVGKQVRAMNWISPHSYVTQRTFQKYLKKHGLKVIKEMPESAYYAPSYAITKA